MKSIEKKRQQELEEIDNYNKNLQKQVQQALDTMSVNKMIKFLDSLNKIEGTYNKQLTESQKQKEWDKIERLFQGEIKKNEKKTY